MYSSIHRGKGIIEIMNTVSVMVLVHRVHRCCEDVDVVVGSVRVC